LSGAGGKHEHSTIFLNGNVRAETPLAAPKGIQIYRTRRTFEKDDFRLKDPANRKFSKFGGKMEMSER
jgi:hypothetical protein